ncbi:hypothetical protein MFIFM68171_10902 [Madurella fahalii]|uniref:Kinetochore-associated protein MTW1 n=1 Tax=Madurella fahalii TaxID=1157608 RepID=A0ABQ0GSH0_9PEZI
MASRSDTELLTEHFGYPPVSLLDEIINAVNFLAERALHSIEQGLLNAPPASLGFRPSKYSAGRPNGDANGGGETPEELAARMHREEVESGTHQLETLLWASIDKNFDRFEIYVLRNILTLKAEEMGWMRLGHYDGLEFPAPGQEDAAAAAGGGGDDGKLTVESVNRLRRRLQASQRLNTMLVAERARNAALLGEVRRLVGAGAEIKAETTVPAGGEEQRGEGHRDGKEKQQQPFRFLRDKGQLTDGDAETPLTTTTAFSLSQLQALRELSTSLREIMPDLAGSAGDEEDTESVDKGGKKSWRRERLEYVETATRKHLENVRGLEFGKNGEVRDGEWDGGGPSLARGEVESLEKVVTLLGGGAGEQDKMDES